MRVLFVYPNLRGMNMLPPAVGLLSAILKENGHKVKLFDTTYYENLGGFSESVDSDGTKVERLQARPYHMPKQITVITTDVFEDFRKAVESFGPDLIAVSATEDMFLLAIELLNTVLRTFYEDGLFLKYIGQINTYHPLFEVRKILSWAIDVKHAQYCRMHSLGTKIVDIML